jgi:hypothetical protein
MPNDTTVVVNTAPASNQDERYELLAEQVRKLSIDMHAMKGNLAANTSITKDVADNQDLMKTLMARINVEKIIELIDAVDSMRGGVKVLGWLERPAKWVAAMAGAAAALYALWKIK